MSRYTLLEPREDLGRNVPVTSYEALAIHHPNTNRDAVRRGDAAAVDSEAAVVNGELEAVRRSGDATLVKKDIIFLDTSGRANVPVPAPIEGYAHYLNPNDYGGVRIYDKPFGTPGAQLVGQVLHMDDRTFTKREGEFIRYGEPLGIQSGTGPNGRGQYGVHAHVEVEAAQFERYINDVLQGRIQNNGMTAAPSQSTDSGTLKDTLLIKGEEGPGVKKLQEALNAAGITVNGQPLPTTGYFGDLTYAAVTQYQQQKGLEPVDGKAGKDTLTALGIYPGQQQAPTPTPTQPAPTQPDVSQPQPTQPQPTQPQPQQPQPPSSGQQNPYGFGPDNELGRLIGRGEGSYNSYNRGSAGDSGGREIDFSQMTVGEVMRRQQLYVDNPRNPEGLFAVGKYQFVPDTLKETVNALGIDRNAKFTPQLQEKMFADYLIDEKRPSVHDYITGKTSGAQGLERAQHALALEFASVGDPRNGGRSAYDGIAGNSATITPREVQTALDHMREQYQRNVQSGMSADQAYKALSGDPNNYSQSAGATGQTQGQSGSLDDKLLIKGEEGPGVRRLQEALNAAGIKVNGEPLPTTGYFGDLTYAAVMQYQQQKGLDPVDGKAGKDTLTALGIYPGQQQATPQPATPQPATPAATGEQPATTPPTATAPVVTVPAPAASAGEQPSTTPPATATPTTPTTPTTPAPPVEPAPQTPRIDQAGHPDNRLYTQAVSNLEQMGPNGGFDSRDQMERAAAALAADAKLTGLTQIDHVARSSNGEGLIAVQGNDPWAPEAKRAFLDVSQATAQTLEQSTQMADSRRTDGPNPAQQGAERSMATEQANPVLIAQAAEQEVARGRAM